MSLGQNDNGLLKILADEILRKENAELKEQNSKWLNLSIVHEKEVYDLQGKVAALAAENERLRKAGDELEDDLFLRMNLNARLPSSIAAWNAAKEGRDAK